MTIKDLGAQVETVWQNLRPATKKILVGAMDKNISKKPNHKISYDVRADWELSRLLTTLDEQTGTDEIAEDAKKLREIKSFAAVCAKVLETQTISAEVFIQLAKRALLRNDYVKIDKLADALLERFPAEEVAEIIRQTNIPHIRAIAYETLAVMPTASITALLGDPLYFEIACSALEQQIFEYDSEEARAVLESISFSDGF